MFWVGKLIGGLCGAPFGIPVILGGVAIGHLFDVGLSKSIRQDRYPPTAQQSFFTATFRLLGYQAQLDGHQSEEELQTVRLIMDTYFDLDPNQSQQALSFFEQGMGADFDVKASIGNFLLACKPYAELQLLLLEIQIIGATAAGLSAGNQTLLQQLYQALDISQTTFENLLKEHNAAWYFREKTTHASNNQDNSPHLEQAYALLRVRPDSDWSLIKKQYRVLMSANHPDKLMGNGASPERIRLAKEKTQAINRAYELIKAKRQI